MTMRALIGFSLLLLSATTARADEVPFHMELSGYPHISATLNPCLLKNYPTASGIASEMGNVSFTADENINLCTLPNQIDSDYVLTNGAGHTVYGHIHVVQTVNLPQIAFVYVGTFTIAGGTGEFIGATGGGSYTVTFRLIGPPLFAEIVGDGVIDY